MKSRPKSKLFQWNAGEVLQAIPKIEMILNNSKLSKIKYRSLSELFCPRAQNSEKTTKRSKRKEKAQTDFPLIPNAYSSFEYNPSIKLAPAIRPKSVLVDQISQIDFNSFKNPTRRAKKKYEISIIKLEKNLPKQPFQRSHSKRSPKKPVLRQLQTKLSQRESAKTRKNMIDESVGNDYLVSQSSGMISQSSLLAKYYQFI